VDGEMKENGKMGQEKGTGEIKNTHNLSIGTHERKKHFGRSRPR